MTRRHFLSNALAAAGAVAAAATWVCVTGAEGSQRETAIVQPGGALSSAAQCDSEGCKKCTLSPPSPPGGPR